MERGGDFLTDSLALRAPQRLWHDVHFWLALALPIAFWFGIRLLMPSLGVPRSVGFWLTQVLLLPILEELLFRGWMQGNLLHHAKLSRRCCGVSLANLLTAMAFSFAHFFAHPPLWAAGVIVPALVFGYFRERHASIYPAILLHVYYNGGYFLLLE